jgi:O-acetyl-ADP-ribose deacetylase (regulator of RNase III)
MSTKSKKYFLIDELVTQANEALPSELALTERTVRYYQSNNLIGKGLKISELPEEFGSKIVQRGNQRYFTPADCTTVVDIRTALEKGASIELLGGGRTQSNEEQYLLPVLQSRSIDYSTVYSSSDHIEFSRSFQMSEIVSDYVALPEVLDAWSLQLRSDLTLNGTGARPNVDTIRELQKFVSLNFAPEQTLQSSDEYDYEDEPTTGRVRIEIELVDIAAPFSGLLVNASNAEVTPGGGASGRIWEVCGVEELSPQRADSKLPLKPGQVAFTTAGRGESRGFTGVIHAYGPRWTSPVDKESLNKGKKQVPMNGEEQTLVRTWENILSMADECGDNRIAAPLISSGLFGYPFQDCAETTFETILRTPTRVTHVHIRTVSRRSFDQLVEARNRVLRKLDIA